MARIVNLNQARKARDKTAREAQAAANRVAHGRSKAEKQADRAAAERRARLLDGVKREP
ncbi:MAG: DUF4169 family protein [Alphaproteobacteria bacterium]|jgi:hypothetical protein|nr:DUF4169 family protein [Alphaproteobacteria bacterium]